LNQVESEVQLAPEILDQLRQYDTCTLENAIERFQVRLRNEGYAGPALKCLTGEFPTIVGYAVTSRARTADPPMSGHPYFERTDSWEALVRLPAPRIAVIQDMDAQPGAGAVSGDVHCAILQRLGCVALATNGAVHDLPAIRDLGFSVFAQYVTVGHAYVHSVDFGVPVNVCGLTVQSGDLLCGDSHGLLLIPKEIAAKLPAVAGEIRRHERTVIDFCKSHEFSIDRLRTLVQEIK
jgi:regulator of RNase E activity RraA